LVVLPLERVPACMEMLPRKEPPPVMVRLPEPTLLRVPLPVKAPLRLEGALVEPAVRFPRRKSCPLPLKAGMDWLALTWRIPFAEKLMELLWERALSTEEAKVPEAMVVRPE
jgi:hypothetical protein